jgi:HSP20 family protein
MSRNSWLPSFWNERREIQEPFQVLRRQLDDLFEDWTHDIRGPSSLRPRLELSESDNDMVITVELPGVEQKDVEVNLSGRQLSIKGEKRSEKDEKKEDKDRVYHRTERTYGAFQRVIPLPFDVDGSAVKAIFRDGVLTITLPKPQEMRAKTTKIEVSRPK